VFTSLYFVQNYVLTCEPYAVIIRAFDTTYPLRDRGRPPLGPTKMAVYGNPHDPQAPQQRPKHPAASPGSRGFRPPRLDHIPHPGELDPWNWLERFDRDLADALEDSQYELDGGVPDWPERYADDGSEE